MRSTSVRRVVFWGTVFVVAVLLFGFPFLMEPDWRWLLVSGSDIEGPRKISLSAAAMCIGLTIAVVPFLLSLFERRWGRARDKWLIAFGVIAPPVFLLACLATLGPELAFVSDRSILFDPATFLSATFLGAAGYGLSSLHRRLSTRIILGALTAALASAALFIADAYSQPLQPSPFMFDAIQLEWKVPLAGVLMLSAAFLGALKRLGSGAKWTRGWLRAALFLTGWIVLLSTSHYPKKWKVSDIEGIYGFHITPEGDIFLNIFRTGKPVGWGPDATLLYRARSRVLECVSRRPLGTTWRELIVSPDGSRVITTEIVSPLGLIFGKLLETNINDVTGEEVMTVSSATLKDVSDTGIAAPWIGLGPGKSYALYEAGMLRGRLVDGLSFKTPQPNWSGVNQEVGGRIRFYDEEFSFEDGKIHALPMPPLPPGEFVHYLYSPTGKKAVAYVGALPKAGEVSVYLLGSNTPPTLIGSFHPDPNRMWPPVCWKENDDAVFISIATVEKAFPTQETDGRRSRFAGTRIREMREIGGRVFALVTDRQHGTPEGLYEVDPTFTRATQVARLSDIQWFPDSIVYSTWDDPRGLVVRFWPKTGTREVLLAALTPH